MSVAADHRVVRLAEDADENGLIERRVYEDAVVLGPAVVVPIEDVTLDNNTFVVDPKGLFIEFPEGSPIQGGIGLRHVAFRRCELRNIAIAGTRDVIDRIRAQFEFPEAQAAAPAAAPR
jgi:hypothetical protein